MGRQRLNGVDWLLARERERAATMLRAAAKAIRAGERDAVPTDFVVRLFEAIAQDIEGEHA